MSLHIFEYRLKQGGQGITKKTLLHITTDSVEFVDLGEPKVKENDGETYYDEAMILKKIWSIVDSQKLRVINVTDKREGNRIWVRYYCD